MLIASIGRGPAIALDLTNILALLRVAFRVDPATPMTRDLVTEPTNA